MRRFVLVLIVLALVAAACGGTDDALNGPSEPESAIDGEGAGSAGSEEQPSNVGSDAPMSDAGAPAPSVSNAPSDETPGDEEPVAPPAIDGPPAPDFTLALGEGGTFTLSEGAKPVYLVFWAEW